MRPKNDASIIVLDKFIQATRDSGYKGTYSAISELVDNALQANAKNIRIKIFMAQEDCHYPLQIAVLDDGTGMDRGTLRQALRFGGSSRFDDRHGLGRFGMGLPNSSLSQAKRLEVYTWQNGKNPLYCYLDVDEIASGLMEEVPVPKVRSLPKHLAHGEGKSGTLIVWSECDRLSNQRISTIKTKLSHSLGQIYRYYLWEGIEIRINGDLISPVDPTFQRSRNGDGSPPIFGEPIRYEVVCPGANGSGETVGNVTVTFTELPVHEWHDLSNEEKRQRGITNNAGVSIIRAKRELDYGWFFMGSKRRENYDDWWRCEIHFDPVLDEAFGVTHTKQQIRPQEYLNEILSPDLENMAKILSYRVRQAHMSVKSCSISIDAEVMAAKKEHLLQPLPAKVAHGVNEKMFCQIQKEFPKLSVSDDSIKGETLQYSIRQTKMNETTFFCSAMKDNHFILIINSEHPFYRKVYSRLLEEQNKTIRCQLDLLLLAAARAEATAAKKGEQETIKLFRENWSNILATFCSQ